MQFVFGSVLGCFLQNKIMLTDVMPNKVNDYLHVCTALHHDLLIVGRK